MKTMSGLTCPAASGNVLRGVFSILATCSIWNAKEEGFAKIAFQMEQVAKIEKHHEERYLKLLENVKNGKVFEKDEATVWVCDICGYRHEGTAAPKACPVCGYSGAHFAEEAKNY